MSSSSSTYARLTNGGVDFVLEVVSGALVIRYWGRQIEGEFTDFPFERSVPNSDYDQVQTTGIMREHSRGWLGYPTISGHRSSLAWSTQFMVTQLTSTSQDFTATLEDSSAELQIGRAHV